MSTRGYFEKQLKWENSTRIVCVWRVEESRRNNLFGAQYTMSYTFLYCVGVFVLFGYTCFNVSMKQRPKYNAICECKQNYFSWKSHVQAKLSKFCDTHTHERWYTNETSKHRIEWSIWNMNAVLLLIFFFLCTFALICLISSSSFYTCVDRQLGIFLCEKLSLSSAMYFVCMFTQCSVFRVECSYAHDCITL